MTKSSKILQAIKTQHACPTGTLPGIASPSLKAMIEAEMQKPLRGGHADMQHGGLFGDGHRQANLFSGDNRT